MSQDSGIPDTWHGVLSKALSEPHGVALICHDRKSADKARQILYAERAKLRSAGDESYDALSFSISPHSAEILYIYKGTPDDSPGS